MRIRSTVFTLLILLFATGLSLSAQAAKKAPDFKLATTDGGTVALSQHRGEVVYVDFWATWCPPCRKSFPWMEKMHNKYSDLGLKIIAVSLDGKREVIDQFLKTMPASFTIAHDPQGKSAENFGLKGMPTSYLIDMKGNVHETHTGFKASDENKLEAKIKALLTQ